jgi:hypothetical protein
MKISQCYNIHENNYKKNSTDFNETILNDKKEFVKLINKRASKFNIYIYFFFI